MAVLTLLTDFGTDDYYVAAVKGVVLGLAPGSTLVDVAHSVPAGDVAAGAFLLAAASRWFPAGTVHLAVVDPGVGGDRRIVAARAGGALFVAPDNGLLTGVLGASGTAETGAAPTQFAPELRAVARTDLYLPGPGSTFHGRDRFAPVAAYLLRGEPFAELGPPIDDPVRLPWEPPRHDGEPGRTGTVLRGRVVWIDRFGNLVTDVPSDWLGDRPLTVTVWDPGGTASGDRTADRRADHFAAVPPGVVAAMPGSLGTLELAANGADLARRWRVERGAAVTVRLR